MTLPRTSARRKADTAVVLSVIHAKPKPPKRAKAKRTPINKPAIITARGWLCECGCGRPGTDLHHCLIGRQKRFSAWLDVEENLVLVTHEENVSRAFDNLPSRKKFWKKQVRRYGQERMMQWVKSLPAKLQHRIDFI